MNLSTVLIPMNVGGVAKVIYLFYVQMIQTTENTMAKNVSFKFLRVIMV